MDIWKCKDFEKDKERFCLNWRKSSKQIDARWHKAQVRNTFLENIIYILDTIDHTGKFTV